MSFYTFEVRNIKPVPIPVILPKTNNINEIFKNYMQTEKKIYFGNPTIDINQLKTAAKVNNF